jgi:hypothetical protein
VNSTPYSDTLAGGLARSLSWFSLEKTNPHLSARYDGLLLKKKRKLATRLTQRVFLVPGCVAVSYCSLFSGESTRILWFYFWRQQKKQKVGNVCGKMKRFFDSSVSAPLEAKTHNKSQCFGLSFLSYSDEEIGAFLKQQAFKDAKSHDGLIEGSSCKVLQIGDGRITLLSARRWPTATNSSLSASLGARR